MYVVDQSLDDKIVIENYKTKEKKIIKKSDLVFRVKDGDILKLVDGKFVKDDKLKEEKKNNLKARLEKLKKD